MPQRYICANFGGKYWTITELKGYEVNMICEENCFHRELWLGGILPGSTSCQRIAQLPEQQPYELAESKYEAFVTAAYCREYLVNPGVNICFKQHFDTRYLVFYNPSPPRMFLSLDLLSEYRIQHIVPSNPFMSHLATQLGYSAGEFQALQLIVLATFYQK